MSTQESEKLKAVSNTVPIGQILDSDVSWMKQALELARQAREKDEVPVGAIIVKDNTCVAAAYNIREQSGNPIAHAEMLVIQEASQNLATGV